MTAVSIFSLSWKHNNHENVTNPCYYEKETFPEVETGITLLKWTQMQLESDADAHTHTHTLKKTLLLVMFHWHHEWRLPNDGRWAGSLFTAAWYGRRCLRLHKSTETPDRVNQQPRRLMVIHKAERPGPQRLLSGLIYLRNIRGAVSGEWHNKQSMKVSGASKVRRWTGK